MKSKTKRTQKDYFLAFKLSVVDQVEAGELSCKQANSVMASKVAQQDWLRKHVGIDWSQGIQPAVPAKAMSDKPLDLEQRIKELEQQLAETQQKADLFNSVVDILKHDHGVRVVKNASRQVIEQRKVTGLTVTRACQILSISRQT